MTENQKKKKKKENPITKQSTISDIKPEKEKEEKENEDNLKLDDFVDLNPDNFHDESDSEENHIPEDLSGLKSHELTSLLADVASEFLPDSEKGNIDSFKSKYINIGSYILDFLGFEELTVQMGTGESLPRPLRIGGSLLIILFPFLFVGAKKTKLNKNKKKKGAENNG